MNDTIAKKIARAEQMIRMAREAATSSRKLSEDFINVFKTEAGFMQDVIKIGNAIRAQCDRNEAETTLVALAVVYHDFLLSYITMTEEAKEAFEDLPETNEGEYLN